MQKAIHNILTLGIGFVISMFAAHLCKPYLRHRENSRTPHPLEIYTLKHVSEPLVYPNPPNEEKDISEKWQKLEKNLKPNLLVKDKEKNEKQHFYR